MMKCPNCSHPEMVSKTVDETLTYKDKSMTLHKMKGLFCTSCNEGIWDDNSYNMYIEAQEALLRSSNIASDIRRIRKKHNLTQKELSEIVGVGVVAFSRYERGVSKPSAPLVKLLKLADRHPGLLEELKQISSG